MYLREIYRRRDGSLGYRCSGEPTDDFERKGGTAGGTTGRKCICNGLAAAVGLGQRRHGEPEPPIVTAGDDLKNLARLIPDGASTYAAADVVDYLLDRSPA